MMLKLTTRRERDRKEYTIYVKVDHIAAVYKEEPDQYTHIVLFNGGCISVKEDVDTVLLMMQADIRLTPEEWKESRIKT